MRKAILTALTMALVVAGAVVAFGSSNDGQVPTTTTTTTTTTDGGAEDISGPCDEAEHANDPRCAPGGDRDDDGRGRDHPEDDAGNVGDVNPGVVNPGVDISGPCDEAEHANDPRCTGAIPVGDDDRVDNSGPGSLNSGPGSVNSGHDDDGDDDNSGHGSSGSGGDDDSSGHGSGGEDD
jgi:hypothetical protein